MNTGTKVLTAEERLALLAKYHPRALAEAREEAQQVEAKASVRLALKEAVQERARRPRPPGAALPNPPVLTEAQVLAAGERIRQGNVTVKQVALELGVYPQTLAHALNGVTRAFAHLPRVDTRRACFAKELLAQFPVGSRVTIAQARAAVPEAGKSINAALSRLAKAGQFNRLDRGVYERVQ